MTGLRRLANLHRRWLMLAMLVAMAARVLVPAGWMPVAGPAGVTLGLCDGGAMAPADMAMAMAASQDRLRHAGVPMHHQGAPDHPCAFAGAAASVDVPVLAALPVMAAGAVVVPAAVVALVAPGRGLAAPPPPSHAPPPIRA